MAIEREVLIAYTATPDGMKISWGGVFGGVLAGSRNAYVARRASGLRWGSPRWIRRTRCRDDRYRRRDLDHADAARSRSSSRDGLLPD